LGPARHRLIDVHAWQRAGTFWNQLQLFKGHPARRQTRKLFGAAKPLLNLKLTRESKGS